MRNGKQIKTIILELLSDGQTHTTSEIHSTVRSKGIKLEEKSTLVRNIMHNLKKENSNLLNPSRGVYQLLTEKNTTNDHYKDLNSAIATIEKTLSEYKRFNWYSCSNEELEIARTKVKSLLKLAHTISTELK